MPGGKITIKQDLPDLESYLARKRYPLDKWLVANNVTSPEAFKSLLSSNKWNVTPEFQNFVFELLKPVFVPSVVVVEAPEVAVQTIAIISEPVVVSPPAEEPVVEQQEVFTVEEPVVSVPEEPLQTLDEVSLVSSHSFKERKKSR